MTRRSRTRASTALLLGALVAPEGVAWGQSVRRSSPPSPPAIQPASSPSIGQAAARPPVPDAGTDYVIGPADVLSIVVWREKDLSSDVLVRPDGKISLPLLNDIQAAGLTPEQLRRQLTEDLRQLLEDPVVTVVVREIQNNKVFVTGQVSRPGSHPLAGPTTVLQMIAIAGGLTDFADRDSIIVTRIENGAQRTFKYNHDKVVRRGDMSQNILLKPGDTIVVP